MLGVEIGVFDINNKPVKSVVKAKLASKNNLAKALKGDKAAFNKLSPVLKEVCELRSFEYSRLSLESLLFASDITEEEIVSLLEISVEVLNEYKYWFCDVKQYFSTFFKKRIFIETKLKEAQTLEGEEKIKLISDLLFKKWSLLLGKEFVIWKFNLKSLDITRISFLNEVTKEAFFYYKELSLSEKNLETQEFAKLINTMVKTIKEIEQVSPKKTTEQNIITDIKEALGLEIEETTPKYSLDDKIDPSEFVVNSKIQ